VYHDILVGDVLHHSAAAGLRFEADGRPVTVVEQTIQRGHVADAAGDLAAHGHAALAVGKVRILNQDVLGGPVNAQAVGILARLDGDAVVVVLEVGVVDMYMLR